MKFVILIIIHLLSFRNISCWKRTFTYNKRSSILKNLIHSTIDYNLLPQIKTNIAYFYLRDELCIRDDSLEHIMTKYPWILYLRVEENLRPTVHVLESFGFGKYHIKGLVEQVPSILAINYNFTLSEKLISLQKIFYLNNPEHLIRVVTKQPFLLTSSIMRNMEIAAFFMNTIGLSFTQIRNLLLISPSVAMTSKGVLHACWAVLTDIYGFRSEDAKKLIIKCPRVLTSHFLAHSSTRVHFLQEELGLVLPFSDAQKIILKFPPILYLDVAYFLVPNIKILRHRLQLDFGVMSTMVSQFPQLLGLNPKTLDRLCVTTLQLLTGCQDDELCIRPVRRQVEESSVNRAQVSSDELLEDLLEGDLEGMFDKQEVIALDAEVVRGEADLQQEQLALWDWELQRKDDPKDWSLAWLQESNWEQLDMLADMLGLVTYDSDTLHTHLSSVTLSLSLESATSVIRQVPNVLSYRLTRSCSLLLTLKVTLNMSVDDLTKCVKLYPRLFSLSVETKIKPVLRLLTEAAIHVRQQQGRDATTGTEGSSSFSGTEIRSMLKDLLLKYPHILGHSLGRLRARCGVMTERQVEWLDIINLARRTDAAHERWLTKFDQKHGIIAIPNSHTQNSSLVNRGEEGQQGEVDEEANKKDVLNDFNRPLNAQNQPSTGRKTRIRRKTFKKKIR